MTALTPMSTQPIRQTELTTRHRTRRHERTLDRCFSTIVLTLLGSAAIYAVSQLFTLAS